MHVLYVLYMRLAAGVKYFIDFIPAGYDIPLILPKPISLHGGGKYETYVTYAFFESRNVFLRSVPFASLIVKVI